MSTEHEQDWPEVEVWFCPVCGERMAGRSYEVDGLRAKCTKTKHKALPIGVPYLPASKLQAVRLERRLLSDEAHRIVHEAIRADFGGAHSPGKMLRRLALLADEATEGGSDDA